MAYDQFGFAVAMGDGLLAVGAPFHGPTGQAYVFSESETRLVPSDGAEDGSFGAAVAVGGNAVVVGAPSHSPLGQPGRAYVYDPALRLWVGLRNSDGVGLRLDLRADIRVDGSLVARGELQNVWAGSSGFANAVGHVVPIATGEPVALAPGDALTLEVSVRRTCSGGGHTVGLPRLWYDGAPIDTGKTRSPGSRLHGAIAGVEGNLFLRSGFALVDEPGASPRFIDVAVTSAARCPDRSYVPFGTWTLER